ncbi:MAG: hypothetical protein ACW981_08665 [Candidatus Hodarchaeales archaeon]|jgi:hypothetical protein
MGRDNNIMTLNEPNIFLIVEFGWPDVITKEMGDASANIHKKIQESDWIDDPVVVYGGVSHGLPCMWIFKVKEYADLDKLLHPTKSTNNEVAKAYTSFFKDMVDIQVKIKHEVQFL